MDLFVYDTDKFSDCFVMNRKHIILPLSVIISSIFCFVLPVPLHAASTEALSPTSAADGGEAYGGVNLWTSVTNAKATDSAYATNEMYSDGTSNFLVLTGYGFSLPTGSVIDGIEVIVEGGSNSTTEVIFSGELYWGGTEQGTASNSVVFDNSTGTFTLGASDNLWGAALTESIVENAGFGVRLLFYNNCCMNPDYTASVDNVKIKVYYTPPPTVTLTDGGYECTGDCPPPFENCVLTMGGRASGGGTYNIGIQFSQAVTGFTSGDITVTGDGSPSVQSLTDNGGGSFTATITSSATNGVVYFSVGNNVVNEGNVGSGPLYIPWGENYYDGICDAWCSSMVLPEGYTLVLQSDDTTAANFNSIGEVVPVRIKKTQGGVRIADFSIAISGGDAPCNGITVGQENQKAFLHGITDYLNPTIGSFALYIPKIAQNTSLRVCSGKTTIGCTNGDSWSFTANEAGTITATNGGFDTTGITVTVADNYWKVSGLKATGGEGEGSGTPVGGDPIPFFPVWSIPIIAVIGWYVLKREGWIQA
jgi:hypothetical protein